jgi:cephalosporin-C deacetylase-like acetyl esterase
MSLRNTWMGPAAGYWQSIREEVAAFDQDWDRQSRASVVVAHRLRWRLEWIRFSSVGDQLIWGWYCIPDDHLIGPYAVLWLPGYSYGTSPPDENSLVPHAITMSINVHGNRPDAPYINPTGKNDYIVDEIDDPGRYVYRRIAAHCLRALQVLSKQPEADGASLATSGMSQGATLALILAAQEPRVRNCFADMPFLSDVETALSISNATVYRKLRAYLDAHSDRRAELLDTLKLFDPLTHASRIACPVWLTAGGRDPSVIPATVESVYERLASRVKVYQLFSDAGHVFVPEMSAARRRWLGDSEKLNGAGCVA